MSGYLKYTIDDAFSSTIGEFGWGQQTLFTVAALAWTPAALQTLVMVFTGQDPVHLKLWECSQKQDTICNALKQNDDVEAVTKALCDDKRSFGYHWSQPSSSIVSDFGILCEPQLQALASSIFFVGFLFGAGVFGWVADKRGRKQAMFFACMTSFIFGVLNSLAIDFWSYVVLRGLTGFGVAGVGLVSFVISTEPLGSSYRGFAGIMSQCFFAFGQMILACLAFYIPNWRMLNLITAAGTGSYVLLLSLLQESPRWLLVQGKVNDSMDVLKKIAQANNTQLPQGQLAMIQSSHDGDNSGISDVLKHPRLRPRFVILLYSWIVVSACYYGISLSLGALKGSQYVIFFYMGLVELIAYVLAAYVVERLGRNPTLVWNFIIGGAACIATGLAIQQTQLTYALVGKFGIAIAFNTLFVYTMELFPTVVRSGTLGVMSLGARIGGIFAPEIVGLSHILGESTPFIVFGLTTIVAGLLLMTLPETLGQPLPDTFEDVNHMTRKSSSISPLKWLRTQGRYEDPKELVPLRS